jgi:RNA polymerase sigma-70 factor, ECF subfamily
MLSDLPQRRREPRQRPLQGPVRLQSDGHTAPRCVGRDPSDPAGPVPLSMPASAEHLEDSAGPPEGSGLASDHELIRAAQRGEATAFQALVERHQGRALRVARHMVGNREDALDLAQEAFLRVFKSLQRFDFEHEFTTWLYRIVNNLAIDHLRKRRPLTGAGSEEETESFLDREDEHVETPAAALESEELTRAVRACIEALPAHFRSVLALRELEGLPCTEIARIVGATHVTVRWRLHRARKLFQEEWERRERRAAGLPVGARVPVEAEDDLPEALRTAGRGTEGESDWERPKGADEPRP